MRLPLRDIGVAVEYWHQAIDYDTALDDANTLYENRRLHVSKTFGGMVKLDGVFDPESGEVLITAIDAMCDPVNRSTDDARSPQQRRADALVELATGHLNHGDTTITGGERPHVTVIVDLESLRGRSGRRCELAEMGPVHPETVRRLLCDAGVSRIVTQGPSEILDVGRRTRTIPPAIRRALVVRDGGCTAPGCGRPSRWCDAHHIHHWADGGPTNLTLLCRRHHRIAHEGPNRDPP